MTGIYLIRHAEAEGNLYRIAQGQYDSNLTDRGWRQVQALERRFADIPIDGVYASDLYRACATAAAIYRPKGLPLHRVPALREICVGEWEQRTWGDIYRRDPVKMEDFNRHPERWQVPGSETPRQVLGRAMKALREIARDNEGRTVALFSHGYVIRLLLAALQGNTLEQLAETPVGDNTAVAHIQAEGDALRVLFRDDTSHLRTPEFLAGETPRKRANGLEPGLYFQPLRLPEQAAWMAELVEASWEAAGRTDAFDRERLLADAAARPTLAGYLREEPVGLVQMGPERGWISLVCIREDCRSRGFGIQLIGQAVGRTREQGGDRLRACLRGSDPAARFFRACGFSPAETAGDLTVWEKDIGFLPEILGR